MDQDENSHIEITVADPNETFHDSLMQFDNDEEPSEEEEHREENTKEQNVPAVLARFLIGFGFTFLFNLPSTIKEGLAEAERRRQKEKI